MYHDVEVLSKCFRAKKIVCVSQMVVELVEMVDSLKLGNLLKMFSRKDYFFNICVLQKLLKWLTCHFVLTIFSRGSIHNIHVAFSG